MFFKDNYPNYVNTVPNRAVLVGNTQSNISTPKQAHKTKSIGYPTPIKYLGLFFGSVSQQYFTIFMKSYFD